MNQDMGENLAKYVDEDVDISNLIKLDDLIFTNMNDIIIYYLCGFICKIMKMKKNVESKDAFLSHHEFSIFPVAELINNRNCLS